MNSALPTPAKFLGMLTVLTTVFPLGANLYADPIPGGSLDPVAIPKYQTPLLIPPVMPKAQQITRAGGPNIDYYEISVRQFEQQILPAPLPLTPVWGYGATSSAKKNGILIHNAPSLTIEARWKTPVRIKWINDLVDENGAYLPHLFSVDPTLHWANPAGGLEGRDSRPTFSLTPVAYTGPVPLVTHLHGAVGVGDESDGYAEAWYLPNANNIPEGYAENGTWYDFLLQRRSGNLAFHGGRDSPPSSTPMRIELRLFGIMIIPWA